MTQVILKKYLSVSVLHQAESEVKSQIYVLLNTSIKIYGSGAFLDDFDMTKFFHRKIYAHEVRSDGFGNWNTICITEGCH